MQEPKIYIGPMSKNVVDAVIDVASTSNPIGLIPSRRQVDFTRGYVNYWTTQDFSSYVKSKNSNVILERDHGGPNQGTNFDYGFDSFYDDTKCLDIIHVDPWKTALSLEDGAAKTKEYILFCYKHNPNIYFEVGTEESIFKYEAEHLSYLLNYLYENLPEHIFTRIKYAVIQSGTSLKGIVNTGNYSENRLQEMLKICSSFNIMSKEHNGDFLTEQLVSDKFKAGLDAINIAPEFGQMETNAYLESIHSYNRDDLLTQFFHICFLSGKWKKWVPTNFDPFENREELIKICGHYVLSTPEFVKIKMFCPGVDADVQKRIKRKLNNLLKAV